ncbi:MAG: DUF2141 domain-containing protein [Chitinispirillaceae bacterium]
MNSKLLFAAVFFISAVSVCAQEDCDLTVKMRGFRSTGNTVLVGLYGEKNASGFPRREKALTGSKAEVESEEETLSFKGLKPGTYAVAVLHDEDNNGKMSTNFLRIPKEGYGFSNNAEVKMKAPSFEQASFELRQDTTIMIDIKYF